MTDESTTDDQSEPDEQKADFAARAEKIRGIGPRLAGELAEEFAGGTDNSERVVCVATPQEQRVET
ncbi:MAG: hypothetical protein ACKVIN_15320, partial [Longimicrobiales bacterium]|jgi:hypothetical protein